MDSTLQSMFGGSTKVNISSPNAILSNTGTGNIINITSQSTMSKRLQDFGSLLDHVATEALHNSGWVPEVPKCHLGTRVAILNAVYHWAAASEYIIRIQWIYGPQRSGKSTLLRTIAEMLGKHDLLLASFFFLAADYGNGTDPFIPTITYQIARSMPNIRPHIERAIKDDPLILSQSLEAQAKALIVLPITQAHRENGIGNQYPRIIVVDGLDERKGEGKQQEVLRVLNEISKVPIPLAILVASRPEAHILAIFDSELSKPSTRRLALEDSGEVEEDIRNGRKLCEVCGHHLVTHPQLPAVLPGKHSAKELKDNGKAGWAAIQVSNVTDLLWYSTHPPQRPLRTGGIISSIRNYIWGPPTCSPPKSEPVPTITTRLFALIIGINEYSDSSVVQLQGAVADANEMEKYLKERLGVPNSHIKKILDKQASRANIIQGFQDFIDNTSTKWPVQIQKDDAILVYFAGHGQLVAAPAGWPSKWKNNQIECIVPHDLCRTEGKFVDAIPDTTLVALIDGIASKLGNNITVIFDSCHSGSATRGNRPDILYRKAMLENYSVRPDLDQKLLSTLEASKCVSSSIGEGQESHTLLAACSSDELAREQCGRGQFTVALLKLLNKTSPDQITYAEVLDRLEDIPGQNPQLRGNPNRILFNSKAAYIGRRCHKISFNSETRRYELAAGAAHGICKDAEFEIYSNAASIPGGSGLGIVVAERVEAFHSIMAVKGQLNLQLNYPAVAVQTKAGEEEELKLHLGLDDQLHPVFQAIRTQFGAGPNTRRLALVDRSVADLEIVPEGNGLAFKILDKAVTDYNLSRLSGIVERSVKDIVPTLEAAAHYYHFLKRSRISPFIETNINIQFLHLEYSEHIIDPSTGGRLKVPVGKNLIEDDRIILDIEDEEDMYGIKITNHSGTPLYVNVFYFDNSDLSIQSYYESGGGDGFRKDEPLRPFGGELTVGYGPGGGQAFVFSVPEGRDVDVGFLKFFLSTSPVDLSAVPQISPFESGRKSGRKKEEPFVGWGTILIPFIQRRPKSLVNK